MITPKVGNTYRYDGTGFQAATPKIYTGSEWKAIGQSFLLNDIPGAVGAWSLRQLDYNYTGPAVRVRRDNETKDIGFTASGDLDVQALEDFAAGGNVYVEQWYDQSGEGNDATQNTASDQPQIVSNGTVITENGKPAIDFDGNSTYLTISTMPVSVFDPKHTIICAVNEMHSNSGSCSQHKFTAENQRHYTFKGNNPDGGCSSDVGTYYYDNSINNRPLLDISECVYNELVIKSLFATGDGAIEVRDGSSVDVGSGYTALSNRVSSTNFNIGAHPSHREYQKARYTEHIIYPSDQSENRETIEDNIKTYYSIY